MPRRLSREEYTVGWVCALPVELAAAKAMLDEEHEDASHDVGGSDNNVYCTGSIAGHNIVIVCLPAGHIGNSPATAVATQMQAAFKEIRFGLMVNVGGGVSSEEADIRLRDVVVSQPQGNFGGVVQYDFGKSTPDRFERIGLLNSPPQILLSAVSTVRANEMLDKGTLSNHVSTLERISLFRRCKAGPDILFEATYNHRPGYTCNQCSVDKHKSRPQRSSETEVVVHYSTIASGNRVIKDAAGRDRVCAELGGVFCFEMEAAGLMNSFPCLVIRGICDYADSHKNKQWQPYAAGTAAAYAKELLTVIPAADVMKVHRAEDFMHSGTKRHFESPCPGCALSKRRKHDPAGNTKNNIAGAVSLLTDGADNEHSTDSNRRRAVTLPFHQHERSQPPINDEQKRNLLESLSFDQIDARQITIKTAHTRTCKWLLKSSQCLDWLDAGKLDDHHGFLWIKGKAGAGKSTLMKFACSTPVKR